MESKSNRIADVVNRNQGAEYDAHYLGYFECFNSGLFFEAHEVLEALWLVDRQAPNGAYYKGLIQLAGAFVHFQKLRPSPAGALLKLARANLELYGASHEGLDLNQVRKLIDLWLERVAGSGFCGLSEGTSPKLNLHRHTPGSTR